MRQLDGGLVWNGREERARPKDLDPHKLLPYSVEEGGIIRETRVPALKRSLVEPDEEGMCFAHVCEHACGL